MTLLVPLEGRWAYAGAALAAGILAGALGNALRPVKNLEAARAADACGLQERHEFFALGNRAEGPRQGRRRGTGCRLGTI